MRVKTGPSDRTNCSRYSFFYTAQIELTLSGELTPCARARAILSRSYTVLESLTTLFKLEFDNNVAIVVIGAFLASIASLVVAKSRAKPLDAVTAIGAAI